MGVIEVCGPCMFAHGSTSFFIPKTSQNTGWKYITVLDLLTLVKIVRGLLCILCSAWEPILDTVTQPAYASCPWSATVRYLRAFEDRIAVACCIPVQQMPLDARWAIIQQNICTKMAFSQYYVLSVGRALEVPHGMDIREACVYYDVVLGSTFCLFTRQHHNLGWILPFQILKCAKINQHLPKHCNFTQYLQIGRGLQPCLYPSLKSMKLFRVFGNRNITVCAAYLRENSR